MMKACKCGSYAINHHCHGRDGSDDDLCDVCYWRKRAEQTTPMIRGDIRDGLVDDEPAHQHIEHCLWARNGNQPCPHVQPAQSSKPWVGLTDEEVIKTFNAICNGKPFDVERILELHRAIEAKLKEKNT